MNNTFISYLVVDGKINVITNKYNGKINNIPYFINDDYNSYRIIHIKGLGNIISISSNLVNDMDNDSLEVLMWHMILELYTKLNKEQYSIQRDFIIDKYVTQICGYKNVINTFNIIQNNLDKESKHYKKIENRKNCLSNLSILEKTDTKLDINTISEKIKLNIIDFD